MILDPPSSIPAHLVHDVLHVNGLEYLCLDHSMQVSVHELKHQVNVQVISSLDDIK